MSNNFRAARVELWMSRVVEQASSGDTVAEYCQRTGISVASFYQWKRRLSPSVGANDRGHRSFEPCETPTSSGFMELIVSPATGGQRKPNGNRPIDGAQVFLPGDITISLGSQPEVISLIVDRLVCQSQSSRIRREATGRC